MGYLDHEKELQTNDYTYDINSGELKDRLRLELGDTSVEGGAKTAMLSDAELNAIINMTAGQSERHTKMKAIEAIIAKLSYQVTFSIDGMSYSLSDRLKYWQGELENLKKTGGRPPSDVLGSEVASFKANPGNSHYFTTNMLINPRRKRDVD